MGYLIDTNILSELQKGNRCDASIQRWYAATDGDELFLSVLVIGEIRLGIERLRRRDAVQSARLEQKLLAVETLMAGRILPVTQARRTLGTPERSRSIAGYRWITGGYRTGTGFDFSHTQRTRCRTFRRSLAKPLFSSVKYAPY